MEYADGGDLHNYLQKNFKSIMWKDKLAIILDISRGYLHIFFCYVVLNYLIIS
jgi:hypothetical protein